jgi:hypothetical protein
MRSPFRFFVDFAPTRAFPYRAPRTTARNFPKTRRSTNPRASSAAAAALSLERVDALERCVRSVLRRSRVFSPATPTVSARASDHPSVAPRVVVTQHKTRWGMLQNKRVRARLLRLVLRTTWYRIDISCSREVSHDERVTIGATGDPY